MYLLTTRLGGIRDTDSVKYNIIGMFDDSHPSEINVFCTEFPLEEC